MQTLNLSAGTFTVNNPSIGTAQGILNISGGTLAGAGALTLAGPLNWTGGSIYGTVQFNGASVNAGSGINLNGALVNSGVLALSGTLFMYGGVLTNLASGTVKLAPQSSVYSISGSPDINNAGQFNVSGPGTSTIGIPFDNHGTVTVNSGTLNLTGPSSLTNGTLNFVITNTTNFGTLNLSGNAVLTCALGASINGYTPQVGDSFGLITYSSETGVFSAFNLPPDANWGFDYGHTVFSLYVASLTAPFLTLQVIQPPLIANSFTLLMLGTIGSNYWIQASTNLSPTSWVTLTNFISVDTSFYYTDTTATNHQSRMFRAVLVH